MVWWLRLPPLARGPARPQVLAECRQIDVAQAPTALDHDVADMGCSPQIAHDRGWPVALPFEYCCEAVEVRPAWSAPQMPQHLRCREVHLQHVRPRHDRPSMAEPTGPRERSVMETTSAPIYRKMGGTAHQLPITESAHKTANGRRPLAAVIGIAQSVRARPRGSGSPSGRPSCSPSAISMSSTRCRRRCATSPIRTSA